MSSGREHLTEWITNLKAELDKINNLKPSDRLGLVASIERCMRILATSSTGWLAWSNQPSLMNLYTESDLKEMYKSFKELASEILKLNIKYGSDILKKSHKQRKSSDDYAYVV